MKPILAALCLILPSCTLVTQNRVFPKIVPVWSKEAKIERSSRIGDIPCIRYNSITDRWQNSSVGQLNEPLPNY